VICMHHSQNQAVGVCPGCGSGICSECVCRVVDESILSCPNMVCQEKIANYHEMNRRALEIYQIGKDLKKRAYHVSWLGLYMMTLGFVMILFSFFNFNTMSLQPLDSILLHSNLFILFIGSTLMIFGLYIYFRKNKISL
jgi:hypothetical protein